MILTGILVCKMFKTYSLFFRKTVKMSNNSSNTTPATTMSEFDLLSQHFKDHQVLPLSIIFAVGFLANTMVLFNGIRRRKIIKHFSNYFVLSMACADFCTVVLAIPLMFVEYLVGFKWMFDFVCTYFLTIRETFQGAAIFSITTLAILRVRQVMTNPYRQFSKRTCRILVAGIWILSFLFCTVPFYHVYDIKDSGVCDPDYASHLRMKIHLTFITCILISPMLVATISYGTVIVKVTNILGSDPESERLTKRNRSIAMLLIMLILSCWICYTPLAVYLLIDAYGNIDPDPEIWEVVTILYIGGSALNPVLVLLTMPKDYRFNITCRRRRRVVAAEPDMVPKEIVKSSIPLQDHNVIRQEFQSS